MRRISCSFDIRRIWPTEAPEPAKVPDLMAALEASLAAVKTDDKKDGGGTKEKKAAKREKAAAKS